MYNKEEKFIRRNRKQDEFFLISGTEDGVGGQVARMTRYTYKVSGGKAEGKG